MALAIGLDIGGTKCAVSIGREETDGLTILDKRVMKTAGGPDVRARGHHRAGAVHPYAGRPSPAAVPCAVRRGGKAFVCRMLLAKRCPAIPPA